MALPLPVRPQEPAKPPQGGEETPKLIANAPDAVADGVTRFFSPEEFAALRKLSEILMPAGSNVPGAIKAAVPEFLDFLIRESPADRQQLFRTGLTRLNEEAKRRLGKPFGEISASQADPLLSPLREPWSYNRPADPLARFLLAAKEDVMTATYSSREWAAALSSRSRSASGIGTYWFPIE